MTRTRAVRAMLRASGRRPVSWADRYTAGFTAGMLALLVFQPVADLLATIGGQAADPSRIGAGLALLALGYAGYLAAARALGPVALPAPDAAWLLLSPLPRRAVLARTATILLVVAVVAGAGAGLALLAVLGAPGDLVPRLVIATLLGVSAAVGGMALAVLAQSSQTWDAWLQGAISVTVVLAVVAALLGAGAGRHLLVTAAHAPPAVGSAIAATCGAVAALLVRLAWSALGRIHARSLLAAATRFGGVAGAVTGLDPSLLTWIAEDNHWRARVLRSRPWPAPLSRRARARHTVLSRLPAAPTGPLALAWQDWRRLGRRPGRLSVMLGSAALPALAAQAAGGFGPVAVAVLGIGAFAVAASCCTGERRDADDPGMARLIGVGARAARAARAVLPMLVSAAWLTVALAVPATFGLLPGGWWPLGPLCAPAMAAGALRLARRPPVDHSLPVLDTMGGAVPLGLVLWACTGADLAALGSLPLLSALAAGAADPGPVLAAQAVCGVAVLVLFLLRAPRRRA